MCKRMVARFMGAVLGGLMLASGAAMAQYPDKPIRLIVPYPPGTGTDTVARYTAQRLGEALGQSVLTENRAGGNAIIAANLVATSPADGHTLLFAANGPVSTNVALYDKLPYDAIEDLTPVARLAYGPMGIFVPADSPYQTAEALFEATRQNPGKLNYGSGSSTYRIAGEWLMSLVGGEANVISYKGAAPALTDLAGGQVDFVIADYSGAAGLLSAGRIRMLAATTDQRLVAQPDVPTVQELGYKAFFQVAWWGIFVPAKTPSAIVAQLEQVLLDIYRDPQTAGFLAMHNYMNFAASGEALGAFQRREIARESQLVERFGIPKQ